MLFDSQDEYEYFMHKQHEKEAIRRKDYEWFDKEPEENEEDEDEEWKE